MPVLENSMLKQLLLSVIFIGKTTFNPGWSLLRRA